MPHRARIEALKQSVYTRKGTVGGRNGITATNVGTCASYREARRGESVSITIAASLRRSARKRYVLASGNREDPKKKAAMMAGNEGI